MKAKKFLILLIAALMVFSASSCDKKGSDEGYNGLWHFDSEYHWRDPDESGDDWKSKHNFVNDVCHLCGYSRKTGTVDPSVNPSDGTGSSGEGEPDVDDSKPSHDEFGIGETVFDEEGFSYTEIYGNDTEVTYSFGAGKKKGTGLKTLTIPEQFNDIAVTAIEDYGFEDEKSLQTVTIPNSVKVIGYESFAHCTALQEIVIPDSVTFMDHRAFLECSSLKSVTFSRNLKNLYARTFYLCTALTEVTFPEGLEYVAKSCFSHCTNLKTLYIPSTIKSLDGEAFFLCPITKVVAHSLEDWMDIDFSGPILTKNGDLYFKNENGDEECLTKVDIPVGETKIKKCAFTNCSSLAEVTIPESVTQIGIRAFEGCNKLSKITADGVKIVEGQTFQSMTGLKTVSLKGATSLEREVFFNCSKLEEVHLGAGLHSIGQRCFVGTALKHLYFDGTKEAWEKVLKDGYVDGHESAIIPKGDCWNYGLGTYTVHFKDESTIQETGAVYP